MFPTLSFFSGVSVSLEIPVDGAVLCDRDALQHACVNLLVNAIEAARQRVWLRVDPPDAGWVRLRVEDDGDGIPEDMRSRVFEPFVTGRDTGVGLGLTFVKRAIHEHGGRIAARPSEEGGACFEIELPLCDEGEGGQP